MKLLDEKTLRQSNVVANCLMNRERQAFGDNSYQKEININPYSFLMKRFEKYEKLRWLDICCGRGKALIQVAKRVMEEKTEVKFELWGIDLIQMFDPLPHGSHKLIFIESPLSDFDTAKSFDLITCVHGLHYIGDKLKTIVKYVKYLKPDGLFAANIDTNTLFDKGGKKLGRKINAILRKNGIEYDSRKKLLRCIGKRDLDFPFSYLGADDRYGKNYTGQKTVSSYYEAV